MRPTEGSFRYNGRRIAFAEWGEGERVLVLVHGLLMNRHMYDNLAPEMASRGYRVITVDLLGHGSLGQADRHARLQHERVRRPGGRARRPPRARPARSSAARRWARTRRSSSPRATRGARAACSSRCRCSTTRWSPRELIFLPILVTLRVGKPVLRGRRGDHEPDPALATTSSTCCSTGPAGPPEASEAVLEGLLFGRTAPPREERELITLPALVIGHPADPLHPFTDSDMLVEEMPAGTAGERRVDLRVAGSARDASTASSPSSSPTSTPPSPHRAPQAPPEQPPCALRAAEGCPLPCRRRCRARPNAKSAAQSGSRPRRRRPTPRAAG